MGKPRTKLRSGRPFARASPAPPRTFSCSRLLAILCVELGRQNEYTLPAHPPTQDATHIHDLSIGSGRGYEMEAGGRAHVSGVKTLQVQAKPSMMVTAAPP